MNKLKLVENEKPVLHRPARKMLETTAGVDRGCHYGF